MTNPQCDPVTDVAAAISRLAEQTTGLQRQLTRMEAVNAEQIHTFRDLLQQAAEQIRELTDAKFVTYETLITSQAEKVKLALDATEKAIAVADQVTSRAIEKAEIANEKRFESVNEFRGQLGDQARTFMPRTEAVALAERNAERIQDLATRLNEQGTLIAEARALAQGAKDNRAGMITLISIAVAVIVGAIALFNFISAQ